MFGDAYYKVFGTISLDLKRKNINFPAYLMPNGYKTYLAALLRIKMFDNTGKYHQHRHLTHNHLCNNRLARRYQCSKVIHEI